MPQRFLRPGIRTSQRWNAVSHAACRLYVSILTQVDDYGRYDGRNSILWSEAFAIWNEQNPDQEVTSQESAALCLQLAAANLVMFYELNGRRYVQITQWNERARGPSKWPDPKLSQVVESQAPQRTAANRSEPQRDDVLPLPNPASLAIVPSPSHRPETTSLAHLDGERESDFEKFWKAYPKKKKKDDALKVFNRKKSKMPSIEKVIFAIQIQKKSNDWTRDEGQFIPYPASWLNGGSWDDQVELPNFNGNVVKKDPDVYQTGKPWTLDRAPIREEFPTDGAFQSHQAMYNNWRTKRLTEKQKETK